MPDAASRLPLPTGTVTFLRTDVEGSMALAQALGSAWDEVNAAHLDMLRTAVQDHGGVCVRTEGDAVFAAFPEAGAAVRAAIDGRRAVAAGPWPEPAKNLGIRMGLHSGEAHLAGDDYGGFDVSRAARIAGVGHGGQIILSGTTQALVASSLPAGATTRELGRFVLKDVPAPEHLFQLDVTGGRTSFPPLRVAQATVGNLPDRLTTFVGRSADLAELDRLLDTTRLLTLTGPGGIGKTSLAIELARTRAESLPDGAWFVPLESVTDPGAVGSVIARTLGIFDGADDRPGRRFRLPRRAHPAPGHRQLRALAGGLGPGGGTRACLARVSFIVASRAPLRVGWRAGVPGPAVGDRSRCRAPTPGLRPAAPRGRRSPAVHRPGSRRPTGLGSGQRRRRRRRDLRAT